MKNLLKLGITTVLLTLVAGCSSFAVSPVPTATQIYLDANSFKALGRVSVVVKAANNSNSVGVYEALLKEAKKIGGNDIVNVYVDEVVSSGLISNEYVYHASALAIKHR